LQFFCGDHIARQNECFGFWVFNMPRKPLTHNRNDIKQAIRLLEAEGKVVTAIKLHPDGTFRVMTSEHVSKSSTESDPAASLDAWLKQKDAYST
jgi:hypothetical protein